MVHFGLKKVCGAGRSIECIWHIWLVRKQEIFARQECTTISPNFKHEITTFGEGHFGQFPRFGPYFMCFELFS